jgi:hypothetical protein
MGNTRKAIVLITAWSAILSVGVAPPATPAAARSWRVERDGSGDYTTIQPAIEAAAAGDTILIGPGRYTENAPFSPLPGSWVEPTYVGVTREDLTIRGTNRDAVIIGPTTQNFVGFGPKGIAAQADVERVTIENLTVENVHDGMYLGVDGQAVVSGCLLRGCDLGILGTDGVTLRAQGCEVYRCREGMILFEGNDLEVLDSMFREHSVGVTYLSCTRAYVRSCSFTDGGGGVKYSQSDGAIERCSFSGNQNYAIISHQGSQLHAEDNTMYGGTRSMIIYNSAHVSGAGNVIAGSTTASVLLQSKSTCTLRFNDILPAQGYAVQADTYLAGAYELDLTNNYWGVETAAEIAARIWDSRDDPSLHATVVFEPFSIQSVPSSEQSFGGLKARYRSQEE